MDIWNTSAAAVGKVAAPVIQNMDMDMVKMGAVAVGTVVAVPVVISAVGFTSAGIGAGSLAAKAMAASAVANGGGVAAGSTVAVLQSVGAAGLGATTKVAIGGAAAATYKWFKSNL